MDEEDLGPKCGRSDLKKCNNLAKYLLQSYPRIDWFVCEECLSSEIDFLFDKGTTYALVREVGGSRRYQSNIKPDLTWRKDVES